MRYPTRSLDFQPKPGGQIIHNISLCSKIMKLTYFEILLPKWEEVPGCQFLVHLECDTYAEFVLLTDNLYPLLEVHKGL